MAKKEVKKSKPILTPIVQEPKKWERCVVCGIKTTMNHNLLERCMIWWFDFFLCKPCFRAMDNDRLWSLVTPEMHVRHMKRIMLIRMGKTNGNML